MDDAGLGSALEERDARSGGHSPSVGSSRRRAGCHQRKSPPSQTKLSIVSQPA
jgi:hypothetical protein